MALRGPELVQTTIEQIDLAELARRGWSDKDLSKVAGENVLRVLAQAEVVSARLRTSRPPSGAIIERLDAAAAPMRQ